LGCIEKPLLPTNEHSVVGTITGLLFPNSCQAATMYWLASKELSPQHCLLPHRRIYPEQRLNTSNILHPLWSYLLIDQCSLMEAFSKGECLDSTYKKIQGLSWHKKAKIKLLTMQTDRREGDKERCV
jgi:hypothetical protein